ncbi:protein FAM192A [Eurytemora carolleeae]|uniref:protein FAM192A n=1 Tax=Eurytemora carolleeae TaxID=1294199 RepID=UPI000C7893AE|nr:protein FAM192A [Eurytemora carolleeae]|eukprot:XP_023348797.1 protein FAM192A-like [Eurytemora affinis]
MSSGFVTEAEIEERKLKRQEEWDQVRKAEDPEEAPEEVYDHRSLFDRLEEQRLKKQADWDEEHKFKNQFRGLDDEEVDFLDKIDDIRTEAERKLMMEEKMELEEYQRKQNKIREQELENRLRHEIKGPDIKRAAKAGAGRSKQQMLLMGVVKRKSSESSQSEEKKPKLEKAICQTEKVVAKENIQLDASQTKMVPKTENAAIKFEQENAAKLTAASGLMSLLGDYGSDSDDES